MDRNAQVFLRLAVSGYLLYLAWQIVSDQLAGKSTMRDVFAYLAAAVMALAAGAFIVWSLVKYRADKAGEQNEAEVKGNDEER